MKPGTRIRLAAADIKTSQMVPVIKTDAVQVIHLLIPSGQQIPTYESQGETVIHCLEGSVSLSAQGHTYELARGELLYLLTKEPFSLRAKADASVLVTMIARRVISDVMIGN